MEKMVEKLRKDVEKAIIAKAKCAKQINNSTGKKYELYRQKFKVLNEKYWLLQEKLDYYESNFIVGDNEIELKCFGNSIENMYGIYLKGEGIKVGHIDYRGYHDSDICGDIGYVIDANFNGHNYAYKALCLLSSYLYQNHIPDFYISVFVNNRASLKTIIKTIMNYGGDIIGVNGDIVTFMCLTRELDKMKKTSS